MAPRGKTGRPIGRPEREITPRDVKTARLMALGGATDDEIRECLQIGRTLFNKWRTRNADFRSAIKEWGESCDDRAERSLYEQAIGYHVDTRKVTTKTVPLLVGEEIIERQEITVVEERQFIPPSFPAASRWLANRRRKQWNQAGNTEEGGLSLLQLVMLSYAGDTTMPRPRELELQANPEPKPEGESE